MTILNSFCGGHRVVLDSTAQDTAFRVCVNGRVVGTFPAGPSPHTDLKNAILVYENQLAEALKYPVEGTGL